VTTITADDLHTHTSKKRPADDAAPAAADADPAAAAAGGKKAKTAAAAAERKPLLLQKSQEALVQMAFAGPDFEGDFEGFKVRGGRPVCAPI